MDGMKIVGDLFGSGKMFLPQVVQERPGDERAVATRGPYMEEEKERLRLSGAQEAVRATARSCWPP